MAGPTSAPADLLTLQTLYLCGVAYAADIPAIPGLVQNAPLPSSGGVWECLWGPAQDEDESNLAFVASYSASQGAVPQFITIAIRGTDANVNDIWGVLEQIWEDLDAADPQPMPWKPLGRELVAGGTLDGLTVITTDLTDPTTGQTLNQFLTTFLTQPAHATVKTVVTGHSLGGCLASIVAPWIDSIRPTSYMGAIQPITFAAPTAGNSDFANYYDGLFPMARRFQNSLDVIPLAYYDLDAINSIYETNMLWTPDIVWLGLLGMQGALDLMDASYAQPAQGQQLLPGLFFLNDSTDWFAQALHQHHLTTYLALLTGTQASMTMLPRPSVTHPKTARLVKRIGSPGIALTRLRGG